MAVVENTTRVRHGTRVRIVLRDGDRVVEETDCNAEDLGGALTVLSFKYNALTMSGGVQWREPTTGRPLGRPQWTAYVDDADVLTGDELCDCERCV